MVLPLFSIRSSHTLFTPSQCFRPVTTLPHRVSLHSSPFSTSIPKFLTRRHASAEALCVKQPEAHLAHIHCTPPSHKLRPYQLECIETCLDVFRKGYKRQVVSLPVGSGKTVIFSNMISRIPPPLPTATKTLVIAHREELLEQARRQIQQVNPSLKVEIDQGQRHATVKGDVIVASVPSLGRKGSARLQKYDPKLFKCIIIDEAHHAVVDTYRRIIEHFGAGEPDSHIFVWGCSATVHRHDGLGLSGVFDYLAYHRDFLKMIDEGWLCKMKVTSIKTDVDISDVKLNSSQDFSEKDLARKINTPDRNAVVVRSHFQFAENRKSTLVFAVDIAHTVDLCNAFRQYGVDARFITSELCQAERKDLLQGFREYKFPVLVNCAILTEGTDIPNIDCIVLSRPTRSSTLFQQMFGRGMRLHPDKENCLFLDFVDNFTSHGGRGLMSMPTLLGLDPMQSLKNVDVLEASKEAQAKDEKVAQVEDETGEEAADPANPPDLARKIARITVTEYDNPYDIIDDCSGAPQLRAVSQLSWLDVGDGAYVLSFNNGSIRVEPEKDGIYRAKYRRIVSFKGSDSNSARRIQHPPVFLPLSGDTLESAIRAADTWVKTTQGPGVLQLLKRNANFRKEPASSAQLNLLKKRIGSENVDIENLTKGQAMNMIARLVEGAGKKWKIKEKKLGKEQQRWEDERRWKKQIQEAITVGPIRRVEEV